MKTASAFITASLVAFEERSSVAGTPTQGVTMVTVRLGFTIGSGDSPDSSELRYAIMPL
jgi:hypothetical protein